MRFLNEIMYDCQGWIVQKTKKNYQKHKLAAARGRKTEMHFRIKKTFCYGWGEDFWTCTMYLSE